MKRSEWMRGLLMAENNSRTDGRFFIEGPSYSIDLYHFRNGHQDYFYNKEFRQREVTYYKISLNQRFYVMPYIIFGVNLFAVEGLDGHIESYQNTRLEAEQKCKELNNGNK
jgi:hypothetical protein